MKPQPKPQNKIVHTKRTLTYKSEQREFLYTGNSNDLIADACRSMYPAENFKLFNESGKEIFDSQS